MQATYIAEHAQETSGPIVPGEPPILDVLSVIYEVAVSRASWLEVVTRLSDLQGQRTVLFLYDARSEAADLVASTTPKLKVVPTRFLTVARRYGRRLKVRLPKSPLVGNGASRMSAPMVDDLATWRTSLEPDSAYIGGHLLSSSPTKYLCLGYGSDEPGIQSQLAVGPYADVILRHLARAFDIARWLNNSFVQMHAISQILDRLPVGIIQLDRNGAITELNAAALRAAQVHNGLTITTAGVHAVTETDEASLQKAIGQAIAHRGGDYIQRLSIRRRDGAPSSVVIISLDRAQHTVAGDSSFCALFIIDAEARREFEPSAIVELLGLTLAESRVVAALALGTPLADAATQQGITVNTARTLLARAMSKTGTHSQLDVVRLVLTVLIPLPSGD